MKKIACTDRVETFKCAASGYWGIQVNGYMDIDIPYVKSELDAVRIGREHYPKVIRILTTLDPLHYSNRK